MLSIGMTAVAFVVERRLLKAMRTGGVKPAPRTAAEGESLGEAYAVDPVTGHASPADESGEPPERP